MKQLFSFGLGIFLCLNASLFSYADEIPGQSTEMKCKQPFQGPPGPPGQLAANYASLWSSSTQTINTGPHVPVEFQNAQLPLVGIIRPFPADSATFQIQYSGVYLLIWSISATFVPDTINAVPLTANLAFDLFNVSGGFSFNPLVNGGITLEDGDTNTITGQTTLFLEAGTILQVRALVDTPVIILGNRTFTITQIAKPPVYIPTM